MSVRFKDQYFTFNKTFETHRDHTTGKAYAKVSLSSSWKKEDGTRKYSDWIARFGGEAAETVEDLKKGDFIKCDGSLTREPYEKEGKKIWPDAQMNIFQWEMWKGRETEPAPVASTIDEELPF